MTNNLKYTTESLKAEIIADKNISQETKDQENLKPVISQDAYALCDMMFQLKQEMLLTRRAKW